jgi:hypothetical protein
LTGQGFQACEASNTLIVPPSNCKAHLSRIFLCRKTTVSNIKVTDSVHLVITFLGVYIKKMISEFTRYPLDFFFKKIPFDFKIRG